MAGGCPSLSGSASSASASCVTKSVATTPWRSGLAEQRRWLAAHGKNASARLRFDLRPKRDGNNCPACPGSAVSCTSSPAHGGAGGAESDRVSSRLRQDRCKPTWPPAPSALRPSTPPGRRMTITQPRGSHQFYRTRLTRLAGGQGNEDPTHLSDQIVALPHHLSRSRSLVLASV